MIYFAYVANSAASLAVAGGAAFAGEYCGVAIRAGGHRRSVERKSRAPDCPADLRFRSAAFRRAARSQRQRTVSRRDSRAWRMLVGDVAGARSACDVLRFAASH